MWMRVAFKIPSIAAFGVYGSMFYGGVGVFDTKKKGRSRPEVNNNKQKQKKKLSKITYRLMPCIDDTDSDTRTLLHLP